MICENCGTNHKGNYGSGRFCSCKCARGFSTKTKRLEINEKISVANSGRKMSEEYKQHIREINLSRSDDIKKRISNKMIEHYKNNPEAKENLSIIMKNRNISDLTREKMRQHAIRRELGGHNSKLKLYFHKNNGDIVYLHSSYEIKFAEILEKLNIQWERPKPLFWTDKNNIKHRYYPDFKINDIYIDTKNSYLAVKDAEKISLVKEQNCIDIRIFLLEDITEENIASLVQ